MTVNLTIGAFLLGHAAFPVLAAGGIRQAIIGAAVADQVTAPTKEAAIAQLQKMVQAHLAGTEILSFPIAQGEVAAEQENPWTEFIGMYEGDADFAEIMAEMRAERGLEPHSSTGL
jgi:hypothetical protein